jgi:hypothetical protein
MKSHGFIIVVGCILILSLAAFGQGQGVINEMPQTEPSATTIAVLPVIDLTGEKDDQKRDQINGVTREATDQLRQRGFQLSDSEAVKKAIAELKFDFNDEEFHRRDNILKVGEAVKADYVFFIVIVQSYAKDRRTAFANHVEGLGKTKSWLLSTSDGKPVLSAYVWEGKSSGVRDIGQKGNRSRMADGCTNSIRDVINLVFREYKRDKKK